MKFLGRLLFKVGHYLRSATNCGITVCSCRYLDKNDNEIYHFQAPYTFRFLASMIFRGACSIDNHNFSNNVQKKSLMLISSTSYLSLFFAFYRSDVVLMCFDIGRASSLENCKDMWYAQIKRFCPNTPVILVGCKNDLRFIYNDEQYLKFCHQRSPLVR